MVDVMLNDGRARISKSLRDVESRHAKTRTRLLAACVLSCEVRVFRSSAEKFDEGNGRHQLLAAQANGVAFEVERSLLRSCDFEIRDEAVSVCVAASVVIQMSSPLQSRLGFDGKVAGAFTGDVVDRSTV